MGKIVLKSELVLVTAHGGRLFQYSLGVYPISWAMAMMVGMNF